MFHLLCLKYSAPGVAKVLVKKFHDGSKKFFLAKCFAAMAGALYRQNAGFHPQTAEGIGKDLALRERHNIVGRTMNKQEGRG